MSTDTGEIVNDYALGAVPRGKLKTAENLILVSLGNQVLLCLDAELKSVKWRKETAREWTTARPYVVSGVALIAEGPKLLGFNLTDGAEVWSQEFPGVVRGIGNNGAMLYVGMLKGLLDAYPLPPTTKPENVIPH